MQLKFPILGVLSRILFALLFFAAYMGVMSVFFPHFKVNGFFLAVYAISWIMTSLIRRAWARR